MNYKRVLLKLSGESLGDKNGVGLDKEALVRAMSGIQDLHKKGLSQIDAAIDGLCKSEYMASISNADGSITYQGIANMLCEIGVFRHT